MQDKNLPKLNDLDIIWLAGLIEGEGTLTVLRSWIKNKNYKYDKSYCQYRVQIQMQDKDIIAKVAKLTNSNILGPYNNNRNKTSGFSNKNCKKALVVSFAGKKAKIFMDIIYPFMGKRRQRQIKIAKKLCEGRPKKVYKKPINNRGGQLRVIELDK